MRLDSLTLTNIRSYTQATLSFSNSMLLVGDIGSGKSTILQAIEFALFGIQRGLQDANFLLRHGCDSGEVRLTFTLDTPITIIRGLKRGKSVSQTPGTLIINDEELVLSPSELKAKVLELLGYPEQTSKAHSLIFRYTVYASQENMKSIILERPESRLDTLRIIFGIDKYKQIILNSQIYLKQLKKDITFLEGSLHNFTQVKAQLAELQREATDKDKELAQQKTIVSQKALTTRAKAQEIKELQEKVDIVKRMQEKLSFIKKRKVEAHLRKEKLRLQKNHILRDLKEVESAKKPELFSEKESQLEKEQEIYNRNMLLKSTLQSKADSLKETILDRTSQLADLTVHNFEELAQRQKEIEKRVYTFEQTLTELEQKEKELISIESSVNHLIDKKAEQEQTIVSFESLSSCPLCKQDVPHEHKSSVIQKTRQAIKEAQEQIIVLQKKTSELRNSLSSKEEFSSKCVELKKQLLSISAKLAEKPAVDQKLKLLNEKIISSKKEISQIEQKIAAISQYSFEDAKISIDALQKELSAAKELAVKYEKKVMFEKQLVELESDISENDSIVNRVDREESDTEKSIDLSILQDFEDKTQELVILQEEQKTQELLQTAIQKDIEHFSQNIVVTQKQVSDLQQAQDKKEWNVHFKNWISEYFIPLQKSIESKVLSHIHTEFSIVFTKWFSLLLEDDSFSVTIDSQFSPQIQIQGFDISIDALSGGERTSVALAYRLAINHIVNKLIGLESKDVLILDEPTEGFSTEQLDRVRDLLEQLDVSQLLIVSHEQKVDGFVDDVVRIEKGMDGSIIT